MKWPLAFALLVAVIAITDPAQSPINVIEPPKKVIEKYFQMEAGGGRLSPDGWRTAAGFFIKPSPPPKNKEITVIYKNYALWEETIEPTTAYIIVDFLPQGQIDSTMHFIPSKFQKAGVRYRLQLSDKHWEPGAEREPAKAITGPRKWRIEGPIMPIWVTVDTAIRYVTEMRDKTTDPVVKRNATQTLAKLKSIH